MYSSFPENHFFRLSQVKKVLLFPSLGFRNQELNVSPSQDAYSPAVTGLVSVGLKKCVLLPPEENDGTMGQTLKSVFRGLRLNRELINSCFQYLLDSYSALIPRVKGTIKYWRNNFEKYRFGLSHNSLGRWQRMSIFAGNFRQAQMLSKLL